MQDTIVKIPLCYSCESTQHSSVKYHLCLERLSRGFIFNYPLFSQRTISYTTRLPRPSTQLSNTITLNHFIHHSDSKAVHSVIQCHHKGPFHTPLRIQGCALSYPMPFIEPLHKRFGFASQHISYLTISILHECLKFRVFLFYVLLLIEGSVVRHQSE